MLELADISIGYGGKPVVKGLSLRVLQGEIGCIVGASGCGKTSVLRAIAGLVPVQHGRIRVGGELVSAPGTQVAPERRGVGLVFQDYALFPHLRVDDNVGFGLRRWAPALRAERIASLLQMVGLSGLARRYPHELSGGQQQRVALARALAPRPRLVLLDEPFSSLDVELRGRLSAEVRDILKASGTAAVLVTHDQQEAFAVADRIGVMRDGLLQQWDTPCSVYHRPATRFVADFIGDGVFLPAERGEAGGLLTELGPLQSVGAAAGLAATGAHFQGSGPPQGQPAAALTEALYLPFADQPVDVLLRPDDVVHDDSSPLRAEVVRKVFRGGDFLYTLRLASGRTVLALVPSHHDHAIGEPIGIRLEADHVVTFARLAPTD